MHDDVTCIESFADAAAEEGHTLSIPHTFPVSHLHSCFSVNNICHVSPGRSLSPHKLFFPKTMWPGVSTLKPH